MITVADYSPAPPRVSHAYDMTDAEAQAAFPWLNDYWTTFGPFFARPPGGESLADVCERVYAFLQKLSRTMAPIAR